MNNIIKYLKFIAIPFISIIIMSLFLSISNMLGFKTSKVDYKRLERKFEFVKRISGEDCENVDFPTNFDLPKRSTKFSAGYDFINPEKVELEPNKIYYVKTGIKADMEENEFLMLCNRSSNPKKKNLVLILKNLLSTKFHRNLKNIICIILVAL